MSGIVYNGDAARIVFGNPAKEELGDINAYETATEQVLSQPYSGVFSSSTAPAVGKIMRLGKQYLGELWPSWVAASATDKALSEKEQSVSEHRSRKAKGYNMTYDTTPASIGDIYRIIREGIPESVQAAEPPPAVAKPLTGRQEFLRLSLFARDFLREYADGASVSDAAKERLTTMYVEYGIQAFIHHAFDTASYMSERFTEPKLMVLANREYFFLTALINYTGDGRGQTPPYSILRPMTRYISEKLQRYIDEYGKECSMKKIPRL